MPELPDVEYLRRYAEATSLHKRIERSSLESDRLLEDTTPQLLARRLKAAELSAARRHGKHLFLELADADSGSAANPSAASGRGALMLHFGMTGSLDYAADGDLPEYTQLAIQFADGSRLAYTVRRMLGAIAIVGDVPGYIREQGLGPDALEITVAQLEEVIRGGRGAVKSTLMNQSRLAGLGNIYTDEVLFHARINPGRACSEISDEEIRIIHDQIRDVCITAADARADPKAMPGTYLIRRREPGLPCPRCGAEVEKVTISGRSAYLCPRCQE